MIICGDSKYKEAAEFYAEKLGIPDEAIIAIGLYTGMELAGYCEYHDYELVPYCLIGIDTTEEEGQDHPLSTLAHEMVHARQYVTGDLVDVSSTQCRWKGNEHAMPEVSSDDYYFTPWEIEAYGTMVGLYKIYCKKG
jgi:hypothetical protein